MGVTDEDAQMDLDLNIRNFSQARVTAMLTRVNISPYSYNNL